MTDHPDAGEHETRWAWELASRKYTRAYNEFLELARTTELAGPEVEILAPILGRPDQLVVHPQSGHGVDDAALVRLGAGRVIGVDYTHQVAVSAQRRATDLGLPCHYVTGTVPDVPLMSGCADLVYTGKGALIWLADIHRWAREMARLLRPGGHLFVFEAHPLVPLWAWDTDEARARPDRSYFARSHVNDTFPAHGAVEHQHRLSEVVMAVVGAGLTLSHLAEHPEPFWQPDGTEAAAWDGRLPNSYSLLAQRPPAEAPAGS